MHFPFFLFFLSRWLPSEQRFDMPISLEIPRGPIGIPLLNWGPRSSILFNYLNIVIWLKSIQMSVKDKPESLIFIKILEGSTRTHRKEGPLGKWKFHRASKTLVTPLTRSLNQSFEL